MMKKTISLFLALCLLLALLPALALPAAASDGTVEVSTSQQLLDACAAGGTRTVRLMKDVTYHDEVTTASEALSYVVQGDLTLDLNGHKFDYYADCNVKHEEPQFSPFVIPEGSSLKVRDLREDAVCTLGDHLDRCGEIACRGAYAAMFTVDGTVDVEGVVVNIDCDFFAQGSGSVTLGTCCICGWSKLAVGSLEKYIKSDCAIYFHNTYRDGSIPRVTRQQFASTGIVWNHAWEGFLSEEPEAPLLTGVDYPSCAVNETYPVYLPSAESNCGAVLWSAAGLPDGLTMDAATGQISGTAPASPSTYQVTVTAAAAHDTSLSSSTTFTLRIGKIAMPGSGAFQSLKAQLEDPDVATVKLDQDIDSGDLPCSAKKGVAGALITVAGDKTLDLNGHSIGIVTGAPETVGVDNAGGHVAICVPEGASLRVTDSSTKANGSVSYVDKATYYRSHYDSEDKYDKYSTYDKYYTPGVLFWADGKLTVEKGSFSCGNSWSHYSSSTVKYLYRQHNGVSVWSGKTGSAVIYGGSFEGRVVLMNEYDELFSPSDHPNYDGAAGTVSGYNLKICGGSFDGRGGAPSVWPLGANCSICGGTFTEADIPIEKCSGIGGVLFPDTYTRPKGQTLPAAAIKAIRPGTYIRYDGVWATAGDGTLSRQDTGEAIEGPYRGTAVLTPGLPSLSVLPETAVIHDNEYLMLSAVGRSSTDRPLSYKWIIRGPGLSGYNDGRIVSAANTCGVFLSDLDGWTDGDDPVADGNTFTYTCIATDPATGLQISCDCPVTVSRTPLTKPSVTVDTPGFTLRTEESRVVTATFTKGSYELSDLQYRWTKDGVPLTGYENWQSVPDSLTATLTITKDANEGVNYYECDIRETSPIHEANTHDADFAQVRVRTASEFAISIDPTDLYFTLGTEKDAEITCSGNYGDFELTADAALPAGFTLYGSGTNGAGAVLRYDGTGTAQNTPVSFTAKVLNSQNAETGESVTVTKEINLHILAQPAIEDYILPDATAGVSYSHKLTLSDPDNTSNSLTFTLGSGSLPAGLSLSADGVISGTPRAVFTSTFTVIVKDNVSGAVGRKVLKLSILARPTVQERAMGTAYWVDCTGDNNIKLVAYTGQAAWIDFQGFNSSDTISITRQDGGELPEGCSVTYNGSSCTFTCGSDATADADDTTYNVTVTTTTQSGGVAHTATATASFTLTVASEPKITTTDADIEQQLTAAYNFPCVVTGGQARTVSLTFSCTGSSSHTCTWTLTSDSLFKTQYPAGIAVAGNDKTATVTFPVPADVTDNSYYFKLNVAYTDDSKKSSYKTFGVRCISGASGPEAVTKIYEAQPVVSRGVDVFGSIGFTCEAVPGASLTASGLPSGLTLVHIIDNKYYIFGTTQDPAGTYPVTITAVNTLNNEITRSNTFDFTVAEAQKAPEPVISLPEGSYVGDQTVSIKGMIGNWNYAFFKVIEDSTGKELTFNSSGNVISGAYAADNTFASMISYSSSNYTLTLDRNVTLIAYTYGGLSQLLDSDAVTRHYTINNSAKPTLHITTSAIPDAEITEEYNVDGSFKATALETNVSWTAAGLPFGLSIDSATGVISGTTYDAAGVYAVTLTAKKAGCYEASVTLPLTLKKHQVGTAATPTVTIDGEDINSNAVTRLQSTGVYKLHAAVTLNDAATSSLPVTWYACGQNGENPVAVGSGTSYIYSTAASGVKYYYAEAVNKPSGYISSAGRSQIVTVNVSGVPADPIFLGEGGEVSCSVGAGRILSELATAPDGGTVSYQWHYADSPDGFGELPYSNYVPETAAAPEEGGSACTIDTSAAGVRYYRCAAVSSLGGKSSNYVWSRVYKVTVSADIFVDSVTVVTAPKLLYEKGETFNPAGMALDLHLSNDATQRMTLDDTNKAALDIPSFTVGDAGELLLCLYKGGDKLPAPSESEGIPFTIPVVRHLASAVSAAITPPVIGSAPEFPTFSGDGFTAAVQSWKDGSGNSVSGLTDKFAAGNYTAKIAVKANSFCAFKTEDSSGPENSQPAFTVNGVAAVFQSYNPATGEYIYTASLAAVQGGLFLSASYTGGSVTCTLKQLGTPQAYAGNLCVVQYDAAGRMKACRMKAASLAESASELTVAYISAFSYAQGDNYRVFFMGSTSFAPLCAAAVPIKK